MRSDPVARRAAFMRGRTTPMRLLGAASARRGDKLITEGRPSRRTASRDRRMRASLVSIDASVVLAAQLVLLPGLPVPTALTGVLVLLVLLKLAGLYDRDLAVMRASTLDEVPRIAAAAGLCLLLTWLLVSVGDGAPSRLAAVGLWLAVLTGVTAGRIATRALVRAGSPRERVALAGDATAVLRLREKVEQARVGVDVVRLFPRERAGEAAPELRSVEAFSAMCAADGIERLLFVPGDDHGQSTVEVVRIAKAAGVRISLLPRLSEVLGSTAQYEDVDGLAMLGVRPFGLTRSSRAAKRALDVAGAGIGLLATAPLLLCVAVLVRLDSPGPALFRQLRVGRDGTHFEMIKFRSMTTDAEAMKDALRDRNETEGLFKIAADPRVTRVGRLLRATSLDELPQLLNVLGGTMSLVGPRPLVVEEDALVSGLDRARLHLTPGMTGPWQLLGPTRVPLKEMVAIDYVYVANWTLWRDVEILVRTTLHVLRRGGV